MTIITIPHTVDNTVLIHLIRFINYLKIQCKVWTHYRDTYKTIMKVSQCYDFDMTMSLIFLYLMFLFPMQIDISQVQCIKSYQAQEHDELTLEKADILQAKTITSDGKNSTADKLLKFMAVAFL